MLPLPGIEGKRAQQLQVTAMVARVDAVQWESAGGQRTTMKKR